MVPPDEGLDQSIAEFMEAAGGGRPPDRGEFIARHPAHEEGLRNFFGDLDEVTRLFKPVRDLAGTGEPPFQPRPFAQFELLEEINNGGMGIVYKARDPGRNRPVALKVILGGSHATAEDVQRFHFEVRAVMSLDHPNIVPIRAFGEHDGQPYFTMDLVEGGGLDRHLDRLRASPRKAVRLMIKVARAVHHAHQRGIVHRDLKPGNILIDGKGDPKVADWGIAKRLDGGDGITTRGEAIGSIPYMSPEQAEPSKKPLTTAADVYSLGVVLYELLTGRVPFRGASTLETLRMKTERDAPPLRSVDPGINLGLELICMKCLERDPKSRYASAKDLEDDLKAWLVGRPTSVRPLPAWARFWRLCRRHPAKVGLAALALALSVLGSVVYVRRSSEARVARVLEEERRRGLRHELLYTSSAVADRVLMKIKDWSGAVVEAAQDPELPGLLQGKDSNGLQELLDRVRRRFDDPARGFAEPGEKSSFENWFLFDDRGVMTTSSPHDESIVGKDFSRREWYRGAFEHAGKRGMESVHVSRVCFSVITKNPKNMCKFTLSVPVYRGYEGEAPVVGVLGASFTTDSNLGLPRLHDERHKVVVVGRWDPDSYGGYSPSDYLVVVHPAIRRGEETVKVNTPGLKSFVPKLSWGELKSSDPGQVAVIDERYEDPLAERDARYKGPWWAGIAPVGNTPFVVIVQRRPDTLIAREAEIAVGQLADLSGSTSHIGVPYAEGVQAYTDWLNAQGGIAGKKVRLVRVDYANRISEALQIYDWLKTVGRVVAIQSWGTGDTEALTQQASQDKIPFLSASYAAQFTDPKKAPYNFIIASDYSTQLRAGLKYLRGTWKQPRKPRVAFVFPDHPYGKSPIPAGKQYAEELGFEIVGEEIVSLNALEATPQLGRLKERAPDFTWIGGTTPSTSVILKDARTLDFQTRFFVNLWGNDEDLIQLAGDAAEGVLGLQGSAVFGDPVPGMEPLREAARDEPRTTHFVRGWVSMMVLCEGLRRAQSQGDLNGPGIKRALETLRDFDPQGLTPPITYTADDHRPNMVVRVYEYSRGRMEHRGTVTVERRPQWLGY